MGFIHMPPAGSGSLPAIEPLQQQRLILDSSAIGCRMINRDAALRHHLLQIPDAEIVNQVSPGAEQDD
ncbi:hypothetical protein GR328_19435 [Microvirga makkahensis]|uniref:Uncharacterized protein n=1 Tax=Microvirga makkahensis TaxID=1128670 RepID=A0A7X3SQJ9_9HYPH|nr:hypothetical protein [Microvirga makkahensis]